MKRMILTPLAALVAASFGGPLSIGAASAATVTITGANCTWDPNAEALNCTAGGGGTAGAPVCSLSANPGTSLPSTGGNVTLTATCNPAATSLNWQKGNTPISGGANSSITDTLPANSGTNAASTQYFVTGCSAPSVCGNAAAITISVAGTQVGGGGGGDANSLCTADMNPITTTLPWAGGFLTRNLPKGGFPGNATITAQFTVPADYNSGGRVGQISVAEFQGSGTQRIVSISTRSCDFRARLDPSGVNGPLAVGGGISATVRWSTSPGFGIAQLTPGQTYWINIQNKSSFVNGVQTCSSNSSCDAIVQFGMP
jgi:hypothetical protein